MAVFMKESSTITKNTAVVSRYMRECTTPTHCVCDSVHIATGMVIAMKVIG